jgi:hypothetical protein
MSKKLPKILIISFLLIFAFQLAGLIFLFVMPEPSLAAEVAEKNFIPQVTIDDNFEAGTATTPSIANYIKAIYTYAIGIVGILAAVVLMFGGVLWITAGGNNERISNAKSWIAASLSGLVLALCSYMILYTINPNLVQFKDITVENVENNADKTIIGCCYYYDNKTETPYCENETYDKCSSREDTFIKTDWKGSSFKCNTEKTKCEDLLFQGGSAGTKGGEEAGRSF